MVILFEGLPIGGQTPARTDRRHLVVIGGMRYDLQDIHEDLDHIQVEGERREDVLFGGDLDLAVTTHYHLSVDNQVLQVNQQSTILESR